MSLAKLQPAHVPTLVYAVAGALLVLLVYHFTAHRG